MFQGFERAHATLSATDIAYVVGGAGAAHHRDQHVLTHLEQFFVIDVQQIGVEDHQVPEPTVRFLSSSPAGIVHRTVPEGRTVNHLVERRDTQTLFMGEVS